MLKAATEDTLGTMLRAPCPCPCLYPAVHPGKRVLGPGIAARWAQAGVARDKLCSGLLSTPKLPRLGAEHRQWSLGPAWGLQHWEL